MGQNAHVSKSRRGFVTIDWMVLAVACIAMLLFIGTIIRISVDADAAVEAEGFHELGGTDTLLAFQDFSFDAEGWNPTQMSDALPGLGPVLGPFVGEEVQRSFSMPTDARAAHLTFDLHLVGNWSSERDFHISLGREEVLTIRLLDDDAVDLDAAEVDGIAIFADRTNVSPRRAEATLPGASDDFVTLHIAVHVTEPAETLVLRLMAEAEGDASWTLDNLTVVATSGDGVAGG